MFGTAERNFGSNTDDPNSSSGKVATPVLSPAGGTFISSTAVTISTSTSDTIIYYTNDGSVPTCLGTNSLYTDQINLSSTQTIKAIACKSGMTNSGIASEIYTFTTPPNTVATPLITPGSGTYASTQTVTISTATTGATLRIAHGSIPDCSSSPFTSPIQQVVTTTGTVLNAIACKSGMATSSMATATYTINSSSLCTNGFWSYNGYGTDASPCASCYSDLNSNGVSNSISGSTSCGCNSGYFWHATAYTGYCASCTTALCPKNTWSTNGYQNNSCNCTSCASDQNSDGYSTNGITYETIGSTQCTCNIGYAWATTSHECAVCGTIGHICCDGSYCSSGTCQNGHCHM